MIINMLSLDTLIFFSAIDTFLLAYIAWQVTPRKGGKKCKPKE